MRRIPHQRRAPPLIPPNSPSRNPILQSQRLDLSPVFRHRLHHLPKRLRPSLRKILHEAHPFPICSRYINWFLIPAPATAVGPAEDYLALIAVCFFSLPELEAGWCVQE